tara:strand:+ start:728 stop:919 length:192 start_codon:yes stop_codon:yes gene_type:complete
MTPEENEKDNLHLEPYSAGIKPSTEYKISEPNIESKAISIESFSDERIKEKASIDKIIKEVNF